MRNVFIFLISVLLAAQATAQAKATVDSTNMLIGDQVRLHLEVAAPAGSNLLPIDLEKLSEDPVEFIEQSTWEKSENSGRVRAKKTILFTVWDSGYHVVPPVPVVFSNNGNSDTLLTNDIPMGVGTVTAPELADIKGIIEEPKTWRDYLLYFIAAGVVLLGGLLVFLINRIKSNQGEKPPPPPPPPLPPHERALQNLGILRSEKLWQKDEVKAYHSRLTHIVREYLEERYGIQALEKTTDEITAQMRTANLGPALTEKMTALLQTADLVKFAKAKPTAEYHERAMSMAEEFVLATKKIMTNAE